MKLDILSWYQRWQTTVAFRRTLIVITNVISFEAKTWTTMYGKSSLWPLKVIRFFQHLHNK